MPRSHRSLVRPIALASMLAVIAACSGEGITEPNLTGNYTLARVNGVAVPAPFPDIQGLPARATGGSVVLNADKTFRSEVVLMVTQEGVDLPVNSIGVGTYRVSRDTVYFRYDADGTVIPAVAGAATLTAQLEGITYEFARR